jgi:hypothetical protein
VNSPTDPLSAARTSRVGPVEREKRFFGARVFALLFACGLSISTAALADLRPSDKQLRSTFFSHKAQFEELLKMSQEDTRVTRIAPDFTWLENDMTWPRKDIGLSEERWNRYRTLFKALGIGAGMSRGSISASGIYFIVTAEGTVSTGATKGYVYVAETPRPIVGSLDKKPLPPPTNGHLIAYATLDEHWYLFYERY